VKRESPDAVNNRHHDSPLKAELTSEEKAAPVLRNLFRVRTTDESEILPGRGSALDKNVTPLNVALIHRQAEGVALRMNIPQNYFKTNEDISAVASDTFQLSHNDPIVQARKTHDA